MGTSTGSTTNYQLSNTSPWSGQQPYLSDLFSQAKGLYSNQAYWPQYYSGNTYVNLTPAQQDIINQTVGFGQSGGSSSLGAANQALTQQLQQGTNQTAPGLDMATATLMGQMGSGGVGTMAPAAMQGQNALSGILSGAYLNPWTSPGFSDVVQGTLANVIPATTSSFIGGGRSDSGLAQRAATEGATTAIGQLANQYFGQQQGLQLTAAQQAAANLAQQQQIQQSAAAQAATNALNQQANVAKAAAVAPGIDTTQLTNLAAAQSAAQQVQQDWQNQINAAMQRWNYNTDLPWNMLSQYGNLVSGNYGSSTTSASQQPYYTNTGSSIGSILSGVGGIGSALSGSGGIISALGSLFSDRNLKTDIKRVGTADNGLPFFSFRYKFDPTETTRVGVMAQDVLKKNPEAVTRTPFGLAVDYERALAA